MGSVAPRSRVVRCAGSLALALGAWVAASMGARTALEAGAHPLTHPRAVGEAPFDGADDPVGAVEAAASVVTRPAVEARTWNELRADATRLLGRRVRFVVQLHAKVERWNTYLSRFGPRDFAAYQFWADEQFPWRVEDFEAPIVRLFARRETDAEEELARAPRYARFEVEGTLREVFLGEPWVEVETVRALPERLTEGTVIHGGRALSLVETGMWKLAESEVDIALQANLPRHAREELERLRDDCRRRSDSMGGRTERRETRPWKGPAPNVRPPKPRERELD